MEVLEIDWKNIDSRFVRDEMYESIKAPKWVDFLEPDESVDDDEAWFCRADCRHPKSLSDFQSSSPFDKGKHLRSGSSSDPMPFGEINPRDAKLKKRGPVPRHNDQSENEEPNYKRTPETSGNIKNTPSKYRKNKTFSEKPRANEIAAKNEKITETKIPQLKSTLSARNLFAGREILHQISEFCSELKKLALNRNSGETLLHSNKNSMDSSENSAEKLKESKKKKVGLFSGENSSNFSENSGKKLSENKKERVGLLSDENSYSGKNSGKNFTESFGHSSLKKSCDGGSRDFSGKFSREISCQNALQSSEKKASEELVEFPGKLGLPENNRGGGEVENKWRGQKQRKNLNGSRLFSPESWRKRNNDENCRSGVDNIINGDEESSSSSLLLVKPCGVRSCPPTPQKFPSPAKLRSPTPHNNNSTTSPLKPMRPPRTERGILGEIKLHKKDIHDQDNFSFAEEAKSLAMFWFLKPCTYG
ncbi:uncharacterized protein LOC18439974 [Amborella trichopoda]|uniref:Uncharacterized protein n=1 Tax=Amborella trichopoda TaxID=13333 RepID=W1PP45_AMBTC|nr:uncharacterized protein LOC18439974 [Amborella trichopoda]XP_020526272.1 uncharacterized protein LOC18439974 [Amborella trichopoda]ERN11772.1 hypothetical protein AMTR_s00022p00247820 [Amborella trichopoda]|eukprot:XP_006850191.1 uncharacterized protein LOC18439974 [Amborella trichopoda]